MNIFKTFIVLLFAVGNYAIGASVDELKQIMLDRSEQLKSFHMQYYLSQENMTNEKLTWKNKQLHTLTVDGEIYKWTKEYIHSDGPLVKIHSNYGGYTTTFQTGEYVDSGRSSASGIYRKGTGMRMPEGAYIAPKLILAGYFEGKSICERFNNKQSNFTSRTEDIYNILTWTDGSNRSDYYFDEEMRFIKIVVGRIPSKYEIEKYPDSFKDLDIDELFNISYEIEMSNFVKRNDFWVPLKAVKKWITQTSKPDKLPKANEVDYKVYHKELTKLNYQAPKQPSTIQSMDILPETIRINPTLSVSDLKIEFPANTTILDERNKKPEEEVVKTIQKAPEFTVNDLEGNQVKLTDFKGKYVLLDFWATWCSPCMGEIPYIKEIHDKYKDNENLVILSISFDKNIKPVKKMTTSKKMEWLQCIAPKGFNSDIARSYGIKGIPSIFLISPAGNIESKDLYRKWMTLVVDEAMKEE